jgi:hypothetical protein
MKGQNFPCIPLITEDEVKFLENLKIKKIDLNAKTFPESLGLKEEEFKKLLKIATKLYKRALNTKEYFYFIQLLTEKYKNIPFLVWVIISFHAGVLKGSKLI